MRRGRAASRRFTLMCSTPSRHSALTAFGSLSSGRLTTRRKRPSKRSLLCSVTLASLAPTAGARSPVIDSTPRSSVTSIRAGSMPGKIELTLDRGVLSITGERAAAVPRNDAKLTLHSNERFDGRFRRVVSLPDDIDPNAVSAEYRDGVLRVAIKRREATQPRRIAVQ